MNGKIRQRHTAGVERLARQGAIRLVFALVVVIVGNVICSALIINQWIDNVRELFFWGFWFGVITLDIWRALGWK